jgi:hypothetical protein
MKCARFFFEQPYAAILGLLVLASLVALLLSTKRRQGQQDESSVQPWIVRFGEIAVAFMAVIFVLLGLYLCAV